MQKTKFFRWTKWLNPKGGLFCAVTCLVMTSPCTATTVSLSSSAQNKSLGAKCYDSLRWQGYVIRCKDNSTNELTAFGGTPTEKGPCPVSFDEDDPNLFDKFLSNGSCYLGVSDGYYYLCTQNAEPQSDGSGIAAVPSTDCSMSANSWNNLAKFDMYSSGTGRVCYDINYYNQADSAAYSNSGTITGSKRTICYCQQGFYANVSIPSDSLICTECPSVDGKPITSGTEVHVKTKDKACCFSENTEFNDARGSGYFRSPCCAN